MKIRSLGRTIRGFFNVSEGRARYKTIRKRIVEASTIDGIHICQLIAAMLIASIGLNTDSTEAVIGAMLICPIMGSVLAISYSVVTADKKLLHTSIAGLFFQIVVCLTTSTLYFTISPLSNTTNQLLTNTTATIWDVLIAFVGGFAGALGISRKQEPTTLIAGVAVATALMPPLCAAGYGLAIQGWTVGASGLYKFLINVAFISFGAHIVLIALHIPLHADTDGDGLVTPREEQMAREESLKLRRHLIIGSIIIAIPCIFFTTQVISKAMAEKGTVFEVVDKYNTEMTTRELKIIYPQVLSYRIGEEDSYDTEDEQLTSQIVATVMTKDELNEGARKNIESLIRLHVEDLDIVTFETAP